MLLLTPHEIARILKRAQGGDIAPILDLKTRAPTFHWSTLLYPQTGDSLLHCAARLGHLDTVKYLLTYKPSGVNCKNKDDKTPLHEAAQFSQVDVVKVLLANGAQVDALKRADWTPLMLACTKRNLETVRILVESGAQVNYVNKDGWSCVHLAAREGEGVIFRFLVQKGGDCEVRTKNGRTVWHVGALHGSVDVLHVLIDLKIGGVNAKDCCGNTPLHEAVLGGHIEVCRMLLTVGADQHCRNSVGFGLLHLASSEGYDDLVGFIVQELGFDVNCVSSSGLTGLHCAARKGRRETCRFLVHLGGDEGLKDGFGRVALDYFNYWEV